MASSNKQLRALITTMNAARKIHNRPPMGADELARVSGWHSKATPAEVRAEFTRFNAVTGFNRWESPATPQQMSKIRELEFATSGTVERRERPTFQEAHWLISDLLKKLDSQKSDGAAS